MSYELAWEHLERMERGSNISLCALFTGLPVFDIREARKEVCRQNNKPNADAWGGQAFVQVFRFLGFNTDARFVKFDPNTDKPCIMRTVDPDVKGRWYAFVYNDGLVNNSYTLKEWQQYFPDLKITSMLQVWI